MPVREIFLKSVLSIGCGRGTPGEGGIDPGVDVVVDAVEFLWGWMWTRDAREWRHQSGVDAVGDVLEVFGGWREGRQRKVASVRRWMQSRMFLRFSVLDVDEGRQRKVASVRAGTPSGDTTRAP